MGAKGKIANYAVRYNSDPRLVTNNHISEIVFLIDTDERGFDELQEAIHFLSECISPLTSIEDLVPELKNVKNFNYILPERNVRPKHVLVNIIDNVGLEEDWG